MNIVLLSTLRCFVQQLFSLILFNNNIWIIKNLLAWHFLLSSMHPLASNLPLGRTVFNPEEFSFIFHEVGSGRFILKIFLKYKNRTLCSFLSTEHNSTPVRAACYDFSCCLYSSEVAGGLCPMGSSPFKRTCGEFWLGKLFPQKMIKFMYLWIFHSMVPKIRGVFQSRAHLNTI